MGATAGDTEPPFLGWPVRGDRYFNAKLVVNYLKVRYRVAEDLSEMVRKEDIVRGIERLMGDEEMKKRAVARAVAIREKFEDGFPASSKAALDAFGFKAGWRFPIIHGNDISMAKKFVAASATFVTTSLTFKLSMRNQDEPVDMGNLQCPKTCFVAQHFYMVRRLNTAHAVVFNAFQEHCSLNVENFNPMWKFRKKEIVTSSHSPIHRVKRSGPWAYQRVMILLNDYNDFSDIIEVSLDFVWIWVEIMGFPATLSAVATTRLVAETIGIVLQVNDGVFQRNVMRVRVTLPLHQLVCLDRRIRVSPDDVLL
ncbi:hypothetical protein ACLB2K_030817 [Fragaria x ananassa]